METFSRFRESQFYQLQLFDGYNAHAPLVGTFCGTSIPGSFESSTNNVFLKFTSDGTNTGGGFTVFYTINSRSRKLESTHATL